MQTETNNVRATPVHPSVESALSQLFEVALDDEEDVVTQRSGEPPAARATSTDRTRKPSNERE